MLLIIIRAGLQFRWVGSARGHLSRFYDYTRAGSERDDSSKIDAQDISTGKQGLNLVHSCRVYPAGTWGAWKGHDRKKVREWLEKWRFNSLLWNMCQGRVFYVVTQILFDLKFDSLRNPR